MVSIAFSPKAATCAAPGRGSDRARRVLENWAQYLPKFVKVMPLEYRRALAEMAQEKLRNEQPAPRAEARAAE